jgi:phosphoribosylanthranilate isomerase
MSVDVKICGINDPYAMKAAVEGGARYVGLVFHPASPRAVNAGMAAELAALVPPHIMKVGLFVNPKDTELRDILKDVPLDMIQLHGKEPPKRVASVKGMTGLPVMKAIALAASADLDKISEYETVADRLLFDAKAPEGALPGGNARTFDWSLLDGKTFAKPWMLAGGLNAHNLAEAVRMAHPPAIDVSSGVEDHPGHKNSAKIRELLMLATRLS